MKKFLAILMALVLCLSTLFTLVACKDPAPTPDPAPAPTGATLDQALEYFIATYKSDENKKTQKDYNLIAKVVVGDTSFEVTYTVDNANIKITLDEKTGLYVVDLPAENAEEVTYTITATIKDAAGTTVERAMKRVLAVYAAGVAGVVTEPVASTAYKLFMDQKSIGKVLFITAEASGTQYLKTNIDPKVAPDWFVEAVEGGYKIYTEVSGVKMYMLATAAPRAGQEGKFDKAIALSADKASVFKYKADINAWYTSINTAAEGAPVSNIDFAMGTYGTYDTLCISETSYYTPENTGVEQFPLEFITKAEGEAMKPTEGPADPTEVTPLKDVIAIGAAKDHNTYTVEKYLVEGKIVEIKSTTYGNMYIEDAEGNRLYIYGLYSADGQTRYDALEDKPQVGDTIKVMSIVGKYNDEVQLKNAQLISKTAKVWTDAEKVAYEKDALTVGVINVAGTVKLPVAGATHADVTIAWELVGTTTVATLEGNVITVATLPAAESTFTVKATLTKGEVTETKEITVTVKPLSVTSIADANTEAAKQAHDTYTAEKFLIEGVITEIKNAQYGNMIISDGTNSILIYGTWSADGQTKYDALTTKPQVGDTIKVLGVLGTYNGTNQMKNGWILSVTAKEWTDAEKVAYEKENLTFGTTINVAGDTNLPVAGATHADVTIAWELVGTTTVATLNGNVINVATLPQAEATFVVKATFTKGEATETKEYTITVKPLSVTSIADANTEAAKQAHDTYTADKFLIEGVITEIKSATYGNMVISDGTNSILIYGTWSADGQTRYDALTTKPQVGDTVKVLGVLGTYNGTNQMKNGWILSVTPKVWTDAEKVAYEKENLSVNTTINVAGDTNLPVAGGNFEDVTVAWELVGETTLATINGNVITVATLPTEEGTFTVKATFTKGEATETKEYTITVRPLTLSTIPDVTDVCLAQANNAYTTEKYMVEGVITGFYTNGTKYGNLYIQDAEGNSLLIYGLYTVDGTRYDSMTTKPDVGDTIRVMGIAGNYNGSTAQLKNATLLVHTPKVWTDAEKVAETKSELDVKTEFVTDGTIELAATGTKFNTVTVTWTVNGEAATGTYTVTQTAEAQTLTVVATITSGEATDTVTFTVNVAAKAAAGETQTIKADFSGFSKNTSYVATATSDIWTVSNAAIQVGGTSDSNPVFSCIGADDTTKAVCLTGKTSAVGKLESATINGGISVLRFNYGYMFSESKPVNITITITKADGSTVSKTLEQTVTQKTSNDFEWVLEEAVTGDFTITITNNHPSNNTGNKDRVSIWNLEWVTAPAA